MEKLKSIVNILFLKEIYMIKTIVFGLTVFYLLVLIPGVSSNNCYITSPELTGPYNIGHYRIFYDVQPFGRYWATIRYPAIRDGWLAPKDESNGYYPGIIV